MYAEFMGGGTYLQVQSIFFEVSVVFTCMVTHYACKVRRRLTRTLEFSAISICHFPSASLLRCVARFVKEPAPQLVPPDSASASPSLRVSLRCGASGVVLLCRQWYSPFPPVVRVFFRISRTSRFFSGFTLIFVCEGYVARVLHAELSSTVLMEPACNFVSLLIQGHWGDTRRLGPPELLQEFFLWAVVTM